MGAIEAMQQSLHFHRNQLFPVNLELKYYQLHWVNATGRQDKKNSRKCFRS
jgi:hypothetical protein